MGYERDEAMRAQEATEDMIRMRDPDKAIRKKIARCDNCDNGPVDDFNYCPWCGVAIVDENGNKRNEF